MALLDYFKRKNKQTASVAKERLQIILAHEHTSQHVPDYLPALKRELLEVVTKYVHVKLDDISVNVERDGDCDILELNITLPEHDAELTAADQR